VDLHYSCYKKMTSRFNIELKHELIHLKTVLCLSILYRLNLINFENLDNNTTYKTYTANSAALFALN